MQIIQQMVLKGIMKSDKSDPTRLACLGISGQGGASTSSSTPQCALDAMFKDVRIPVTASGIRASIHPQLCQLCQQRQVHSLLRDLIVSSSSRCRIGTALDHFVQAAAAAKVGGAMKLHSGLFSLSVKSVLCACLPDSDELAKLCIDLTFTCTKV